MSYLNPKVEVRDTGNPYRGKGLFARENIAKGEVIDVVDGRVLTNNEFWMLPERHQGYCFDIDDQHVFCPLDFEHPSPGWFMNHSCDPNIGSAGDLYTTIAMHNIEAGEELTLDYAMSNQDPDTRWHMECRCGAPHCRKIITGSDWMIPELQDRYRGFFQKNIQEKIDRLRASR